MEVNQNMETMVIEIEEKEYKLGYPTRKDAVNAENHGLRLLQIENTPLLVSEQLFYTGLLANHPSITKEEASRLLEKYIEEGGEIGEINNFLIKQYSAFQQSPNTKKKKRAKIIKM